MNMETRMHTNVSELAEMEQFKDDVLIGLSLPDKELHAKYCYDKVGLELYKKMTLSPDFYPINCEAPILRTYKDQLAMYLENKTFNLVEFGPGAGINSQILIENFLQNFLDFTYHVIDTSKQSLDFTTKELQNKFPELSCHPIHTDYIPGLTTICSLNKQKNILLYLNANISNMNTADVSAFIKQVRRQLNTKDHILIGFDLRKNIDRLLNYYNQPNGLYQQLNLNILQRINNELNSNFNLNKFQYVANYDKDIESINSYLISKENQTVTIQALNQSFELKKDEPIYLGSAYKYREQQIITLAESNGYEIVKMLADEENNYVVSLWKVTK